MMNIANCPVGTQMFLERIESILGLENVVSQGERYKKLSLDAVFTTTPPKAFIFPKTRAEVEEIVKAANECRVALWPYSTAKNWGYCNTANHADAFVLILSRMNRILHVDYELAYAEIEPGVTYEQLNAYMREHNLALWTDCTGGPPSGSVVGNALDRGIGVTPHGDHFANLCGLEVVLPNGSVIRTGAFREDKPGAWHTYKWGIGPSLEGLFVQSNYGIVTKAGVWLMRKPQDFAVGALKIDKPSGLAPALDAVRELMLDGLLPEKARFSNDVAMFSLVTQAVHEGMEGVALTQERRASLRKKYSIPSWTASFGIYGIKSHVKLMKKEVAKRLRKLGRLTLGGDRTAEVTRKISRESEKLSRPSRILLNWLLRLLTGTTLPVMKFVSDLVDIHKGIPNESVVRRAYFRSPEARPNHDINVPRDGVGVLWFVPLLPFRGKEIEAYLSFCETQFEAHHFDYYVTIMMLNARTAVPLMVILYDLKDRESCNRARSLYETLYRDALSRGYQQFRCAQLGWDMIFADLPELKEVYQALKNTLDPNGILAPGRYGIGGTETPPRKKHASVHIHYPEIPKEIKGVIKETKGLDRWFYKDESEFMDRSDIPLEIHVQMRDALNTINQRFGFNAFMMKRLKKIIHALPCMDRPLKILDIGSGNGGLLIAISQWASSRNISVELFGLEYSDELIAYYEERFKHQGMPIKLLKGDARDLNSWKDGSFDIIMACQMMHHIRSASDVRSVLKDIRRLAAKACLIVDLKRSIWGALLIKLNQLTLGRKGPIEIYEDGIKSYRRAYNLREMNSILKSLNYYPRMKCKPFWLAPFQPFWVISSQVEA